MTLKPVFFMAPASQSLVVATGLLHLPQLFLAVSITFPLLFILLVIACTFYRRLSRRIRKGIRGHEGQQKVVSLKKHNDPVQPKDDSNTTNVNGVISTTIDKQMGKVGDISVRCIPSIPLTSLVEIEDSNDDSLYEVVRDIQDRAQASKQASPGPQNLEYMTPYEEVPSANPSQMDECSNENKELREGQTQAPIYAKVVKQRNNKCQPQVQEKAEAKDEVEVDEPPPVPEKHLDGEDSAQYQGRTPN
ncbi:uncharacterized protein [Heterodontus francisci]|uniref:uncharacterized protein n=1 Tax=Heterodontus francisci TaxID=7792 RepID=UPI00355B6494